MSDKEVLITVQYNNDVTICTYYTDFTFTEETKGTNNCKGEWRVDGDKIFYIIPLGSNIWTSDNCGDEVINALNEAIEDELLKE